jgi:hypothetical protein
MRKENRFIGRFPATSAEGRTIQISHYVEMHDYVAAGGPVEVEGNHVFVDDGGFPVTRVSKGHYQVLGLYREPIDVTSDDPDAP